MNVFKDYFSRQSAFYSSYRPVYPAKLFTFLAKKAIGNGIAWDSATGTGQCAVALAKYFDRVIATDASDNQIKNAMPCENIEYRVCTSEKTDIPDATLDLITVAQALHWFDVPIFYEEARRTLKPSGVIVVWCYGLIQIDCSIDPLIRMFHDEILGKFWPDERRYVINGYQDFAFPFSEIKVPEFSMELTWSLDQFIGYLSTWSAVQKYKQENGQSPLLLIQDELTDLWLHAEYNKNVHWPLSLKAGYV